LISNAYEILSDEERRTEYDRQLDLGNTDFKDTQQAPPKQEQKQYKFKDPYKAYEEALKKEEEEAWREKVFNIALITFGTCFAIFSGWAITILIKRTKFYQKIEKQKQEQENRKNLAEATKKRAEKTEKAQIKFEQQIQHQEETKKSKKTKKSCCG